MDESRRRTMMIGGILLGLGLGGFFDGIVLHQVLQWHHMVSDTSRYPTTTLEGLEANTLGDGLFHAATWIMTVVGLFLIWQALAQPHVPWSTKRFLGLLLIGWGGFNLVEGIVNHHLLELHHVRQDSDNQLAWDLAFLAWGAVMFAAGWGLVKRGGQEMGATWSTGQNMTRDTDAFNPGSR